MKLSQAFTALILFILAADFSCMQGRWASALGIPLGGLAKVSYLLVPIAVILPSFLPHQIPSRLRYLVCNMLAIALVGLPIAVFSAGVGEITFFGELPGGTSKAMSEELGFPVLVVYSGKSQIYFPRSHDPSLVRDALNRHKNR